MLTFLTKDVVGGITGPVNQTSGLEKFMHSLDQISLLIGFLFGAIIVFLYYKISAHIRKKQDNEMKKNSKDEEE